ncbi:hypothetical protein KOW79_004413 [Hemibagrus wyckioides]|uniref:Uncharacterized protein n=1 Tax=Hemibagrus wyckioides TaxID=337641 RepID=A0A9D3P2R3_9TELE|nr:hypothetical protein KOW79_004413 [Hemibagrus wyckioides]
MAQWCSTPDASDHIIGADNDPQRQATLYGNQAAGFELDARFHQWKKLVERVYVVVLVGDIGVLSWRSVASAV